MNNSYSSSSNKNDINKCDENKNKSSDSLNIDIKYESTINDLKNRGLWNIKSFVECNDIEIFLVYLSYFDVNSKDEDGNTPLIYASCEGYGEIVDFLIQRSDININSQNNKGNTALICASYEGYNEIVISLLKRKDIDVNIQNNEGDTAIIQAAREKNKIVVNTLFKRNDVNIDLKNNCGRNFLRYALHFEL